MGKKDYKGTILDGRDTFDSWKMDLEDSLLSDDLMSYVISETASESSGILTPGSRSAADTKNISLARMKIRQSINQTHKNSVNHLTDPQEIYQSLVNRYAASNKARLRQLIRMIYDVSTQTNRTVQEKVDDLKRLRAQITSQDKDIVIHEQLLICFLQMSMDDAFDTTVEILNASSETLTLEKVQSSLESKELELADKTIKGETVQFASHGRNARDKACKGSSGSKAQNSGDGGKEEYLKQAAGCWCCGGMHFKHDCAIWHQTKAGKTWLASEKGKAKVALESKEKINEARILEDSGSESENSSYLLPNTKAGMDILRMGIESIDSFDAKSYEYRIEFLGIRFDVESNGVRLIRYSMASNRMWRISFDTRIEPCIAVRQPNRTNGPVRSKFDRFDRTSCLRW
jgi:gag-polypeptide of LTR copia-type